MPDTTAPMMTPARARPAPASSPGARLMRRTAEIPTQKAVGPSRIPKGQTRTTAAIPRISARAARASTAGGVGAIGASMTAPDPTLVRHIARPRPAVAAAATAPTKSKAINGAGPGRYVPQIQANAIDANRSAPSTTLPATKSAPVTVIAGTQGAQPDRARVAQPLRPPPSSGRSGGCILWASGGPVDLDRYALWGGSRLDQVKRCVWAGVGE